MKHDQKFQDYINPKMNQMMEIVKDLSTCKFAVFCGAGISKNSGLPLAEELTGHILERLILKNEDIKRVKESELPFEVFMEALNEIASIDKILDLFEEGEPNTNHILVAKLAKAGRVKTIITTNFDLLLEKAMEKERVEYRVYKTEEDFSKISQISEADSEVAIFKIHGSIDDKNSIRITMTEVPCRTNRHRIIHNKN